MRRKVVVSGIGIVTCLGIGADRSWNGALEGRSGIGPITRFDASPLRTRIAGEAADFRPEDHMPSALARRLERTMQLGVACARMAVEDAGLPVEATAPVRTGVFMGSGLGGMFFIEKHLQLIEQDLRRVPASGPVVVTANGLPGQIAILHGARGPNLCWSTACSSAAHALGHAFWAIREGRVDVALAGGAEAPVTPLTVAGFSNLRAMSGRNGEPRAACRPFDRARDGFVLSEGAAVLVLEEEEHARERGARPYAELLGYGSSCDAYHFTRPDPEAEGPLLAMRAALDDAGMEPDRVDHVAAHGTATVEGDRGEALALGRLLGDRAAHVPVTATKGCTGHALGAAAAFQGAFLALTLRDGLIPPTPNLVDLDPGCRLDVVAGSPRPFEGDVALLNSFGFWGNNGVLVMGRHRG